MYLQQVLTVASAKEDRREKGVHLIKCDIFDRVYINMNKQQIYHEYNKPSNKLLPNRKIVK